MILIFEDKLPTTGRTGIKQRILDISKNLGISPNWLMAVINFETAGTFSPSIRNKFTQATGLIQFVPTTARSLGTSVEELKGMSFIRQLDFVERYYMPYKKKIKGFTDLYLATFFPLAIGKPDNWVLRSKNISAATIAKQNPVFGKNGAVTVGDIKRELLSRIPRELLKFLLENPGTVAPVLISFLATIGTYALYKRYNNGSNKKERQ